MIASLTPLPAIIVRFVELKEWLLGSFGQSHDAMHVHVGLAIFVGLLLVLRGKGSWWLPFSLLAALSLLAEVFDVIALLSVKSPIDPMESLRDVANTLVWPLVLSVLFTWHRRRSGRR
ncbi:MAG: hypothetical protein ABIT10_13675 [Alteraurantiacibacter sp.]